MQRGSVKKRSDLSSQLYFQRVFSTYHLCNALIFFDAAEKNCACKGKKKMTAHLCSAAGRKCLCVCARLRLFSRARVNYLRTVDPLSSQDWEPLLLGNHIKHSRALVMTDGKVIRNMAALRAFHPLLRRTWCRGQCSMDGALFHVFVNWGSGLSLACL